MGEILDFFLVRNADGFVGQVPDETQIGKSIAERNAFFWQPGPTQLCGNGENQGLVISIRPGATGSNGGGGVVEKDKVICLVNEVVNTMVVINGHYAIGWAFKQER